jgi:hypothetical protein
MEPTCPQKLVIATTPDLITAGIASAISAVNMGVAAEDMIDCTAMRRIKTPGSRVKRIGIHSREEISPLYIIGFTLREYLSLKNPQRGWKAFAARLLKAWSSPIWDEEAPMTAA